MPSEIEVEKSAPGKFLVKIRESGTQSTHVVSLDAADYQKLTRGKVREEDLIVQSFQFLLRHEPKESILREFDLKVISRYFPQFEAEMKAQFSDRPASK